MAADLAQAQQRGQDGQPVPSRFASGLVGVLEDVAAALREDRAIDFALLVGEFA